MLAVFQTHYSLSSILTLEKPEDVEPDGPQSIIKIAQDYGLKEIVLVEKNLSGYIDAHLACKSAQIKLIFGLQMICTQDATKKDEESLNKNHKIIVFIKNGAGWSRLLKISSKANTDFFYYQGRTDFNSLHEHWHKNDLKLCIPFFDSFLQKNNLENGSCIPDFSKIRPTFFIENHDLPFNELLKNLVQNYAKTYNYPVLETNTCYYAKKSDFKSFLTYKCIKHRSSLENPNLEWMGDDTFCFEHYINQIGQNL